MVSKSLLVLSPAKTLGLYWIVENKMETTIQGLRFWVLSFEFRVWGSGPASHAFTASNNPKERRTRCKSFDPRRIYRKHRRCDVSCLREKRTHMDVSR